MANRSSHSRAKKPATPIPPMFTPAQWNHLTKSLGLTPRQACVTALILRSMADKQIALEMGLGIATVRTHLRGIYSSLGVADRTELALHILAMPRDGAGNGQANQ